MSENDTNKLTSIKDAKAFGKVAVLYGGLSAEREVSLNSGKAVLAGLQRKGVDVHAIDVGEDVIDQLRDGDFDRAFIVLHGRGGEDGVMQALLQMLNIPYTGTGVQASALGMDKLRTKLLWRGMGLPTPEFVILESEESFARAVKEVGFPAIVKPVHEGSSIGMSRVENEQELRAAYQEAAKYDSEIIVERWVVGAEYTASMLGDEALPLIRLETPNSFYDYEAKYLTDTTTYHCPCGLDQETEQRYQAIALQAFRCVGAHGWGRVDFMTDADGKLWLIEVNTVPGMTDHSLVPMAAKQAGVEFDDLVWRILESSMQDSK